MGEEGLTPAIHTTHPKAVSPAQDWVLSSLGRKWAWQRSGERSGPGVGKRHRRGYIQSQLACVSRFHWNTRGHGLTSCLREHLQPTPQSWLHRPLCWASWRYLPRSFLSAAKSSYNQSFQKSTMQETSEAKLLCGRAGVGSALAQPPPPPAPGQEGAPRRRQLAEVLVWG